jgi:Raf kinase inhibitor-like YbhB/YbcL family protein
MKRYAILILLAACGGDDSSPAQPDAASSMIDGPGSATIDGAIDGPGAMLALTSPALVEGAVFLPANTCVLANTSPQLAWSGSGLGAQSYAVVLTDKTNNLVHWVIYDIPASATGLPANVEKLYAPTNVAGAHQTLSYGMNPPRGYLGPCPPVDDGPHTYEFALYGIDAAALPGATMATTRTQAVAAITQHTTATAKLTGTFER